MKNTVSIVSIVMAAALIINGNDNWGWFLFMAVIFKNTGEKQ